MNDTHPEIEKKYRSLIMQRSPQERLEMGCSMYEFSKELVEASILMKNPNITQKELKKDVFLRFYRHDLPERFLQKVVSAIMAE